MTALPARDVLQPRRRRLTAVATPAPHDDIAAFGARLRAAVSSTVQVSAATLDVVLATLVAGGHLLVEDHPGVGKTRLARALAESVGGRFSRVQATIDLLPGDVVGTNVWRPDSSTFEFLPGPIFANVVLVDELNRATPKTQSGLLEAMQEHQVTVDGRTWPIPSPFVVIATQNPAAAEDGTFTLPPAQLDRFMARVSLGYPTADQELEVLRGANAAPALEVSSPAELLAAQAAAAGIHAGDALLRYVVALLEATRRHPLAHVGASPRAGVLLLAAARAYAALGGRDFVTPDDVKALAGPLLIHRIQSTGAAPPDAPARIVADAVEEVPAR